MESNKFILVVSLACMAGLLVVATTCAQAAPIERELASQRAQALDNQVEDDGENLIEYVKDDLNCSAGKDEASCLKEDKHVQDGVSAMIHLLGELGEMKAHASGESSPAAVKLAKETQLGEMVEKLSEAMSEVDDSRTKLLFGLLIEAAQKAKEAL